MSLYPAALTVTAPMLRELTLMALREFTANVVVPSGCRLPENGDTENHGTVGVAENFMALLLAVTVQEIGRPYVAGSVPLTRICGTSIEPAQGALFAGQSMDDAFKGCAGCGGM